MDDLTNVKVILKSLIISHGSGLSLKKLEDDFKAINGYKLPYAKFGFRSLEKFLESLSDTVRLERNSYGITVYSTFSKKSEHITQMKFSEKKTRKKNVGSSFRPTPTYRRSYNDQINVPFNPKYNYSGNIVAPHNSIHIKNIPPPNPVSTQFHHYIHYMPQNKVVNKEELERTTQSSLDPKCNNQNVSQTQKVEKEIQNQPSEERSKNYKSNSTMDENNLSTSFKQLDMNELKSKEPTEPPLQTKKTYIPNASDFSKTKSLNKAEDSKVTTIPAKTRTNQHDKKLKTYHNNLNVIHEKTIESTSNKTESALPHLRYDDVIFLIDYPLPFSDICTSIPKTVLPDEFKKGDRKINLFISEVHNPFRFWFNIATNPKEHALDRLMGEMEDFYTSLEPNELNMSKSHIYPGQACAALYHNIWHRAEILELASYDQTNDSYIKVFYVDYGTVCKCKISNLKYLIKKFGTLPRQAYRGTLSDIRPYIKWNRAAIAFFIENVADVILAGKITYLEEDRNICHLKLLRVYTPDEKSVYQVHQRLINELLLEVPGFAQLSPHYSKSYDQITIREKHYYHEQQRFPSFEILELGKYPSYGQILHKLQTDSIDLEEKTFWLMQLENLNVPVRYDD